MCFPLLFVLHVPHDVPHIYIAKTSMGVTLMFHKGPAPEARGHIYGQKYWEYMGRQITEILEKPMKNSGKPRKTQKILGEKKKPKKQTRIITTKQLEKPQKMKKHKT